MSKHTPGPWVAELGADGAFAIEADRQGITGGMLVLASRNTHPLMAEQMHANARLIAAAPDMLDSLLMLRTLIGRPGWALDGQNISRVVAAMHGAINKATGDQS